jgi:hypothetical protein
MAIMVRRRITANLPVEFLDAAMEITGKGITETLVEGLEQVQRRRFYENAVALRGKLHLDVDLDEIGGRHRR